MVQLCRKKSHPVFEWLKQDGCHSHLKAGHLCPFYTGPLVKTVLYKHAENFYLFTVGVR